jgi:hypothetical protein
LPDERVVVSWVVVLGGGTLFVVVDWVVVLVVVGVGFSTTVVHEVRSTAAPARSGVRMISFFIVGVIPSRTIRRRSLWQMYFEQRFSHLLSKEGGSCAPPRDVWSRGFAAI